MRSMRLLIFLSILIVVNRSLLLATLPPKDTSSLYDMSIEELIDQEVTIATKSAQKVNESPSVVSVITAEEIKMYGLRDLYDVMKLIPGFEAAQTTVGVRTAEVRGLSDTRQGGRILILLDGTPYNGIMYGSAIAWGNEFNMDIIEKIEIIRGPGSALYGRNAFRSVINIITKSPIKNKLDVRAGIGSYNAKEASISGSLVKNDFKMNLSAKYFSTEGTDRTLADNVGGRLLTDQPGTIRQWSLFHDNRYVNSKISYKNFDFIASYVHRENGCSFGILGLTDSRHVFDIGTYSLAYKKDISSKLSVKAKLYGRNEKHLQDAIFIYDSIVLPHYPNGIYAEPIYNEHNYGGETEVNLKLIKNNDLLVGVQYDNYRVANAIVYSNYVLNSISTQFIPRYDTTGQQYNKDNMPLFDPGWIQDKGHSYTNIALYLQDAHYFTPEFSVTLGGRLDFDSEVGMIFNPRLGMVFEPSNALYFKAIYGEAYRAPTTNEQYKIMGLDKGNEDLKYEQISTTELVAGYSNKKLYAQVSVYYNFLKNMVYQQFTDTSYTVKSYYNAGSNKSFGAELEAKVNLTRNLYSFFNYSYTNSETTVTSNGIKDIFLQPNISPHNANIGFNINLMQYISFTGWLNYHGEIEKFRYQGGQYNYKYLSQDKVGDYLLLNANVRIYKIIPGVEVLFNIYNALNQTYFYQDDINYRQPAQPGRNYSLKLIVEID